MDDPEETQWTTEIIDLVLVDCDPKLEWMIPPSGSELMEYTSLEIKYDQT